MVGRFNRNAHGRLGQWSGPLRALGTLTMAALLVAPCLAVAQSWAYVNHAPDSSRATAEQEARITLVTDKGLFGYGHDYGKLGRCTDSDSNCITFDFMALRDIPGNADVGSTYTEGAHSFKVSRVVNLSLIGQVHRTLRVDVTTGGKPANSYLFDKDRGVVAIVTPNFDVKGIPESIYFLEGGLGIFAKGAE